MRINRHQFIAVTDAHTDAKHIAENLDDLRNGNGSAKDIDRCLTLHARLGERLHALKTELANKQPSSQIEFT